MKIIIKVGTQSILSHDGEPDTKIVQNLIEQIVSIQEQGHQVVLVSSGAVSAGRKVSFDKLKKSDCESVAKIQLLASIGQVELMQLYSKQLKPYQRITAQLLLTKQDFHTRQHYLNIYRLVSELLQHKNILPVINENDSVAIEELMFTDNDELAGLIAALINADKLIILSNVNGVYTSHPDSKDAKLISCLEPQQPWPSISDAKSQHGRGGMQSKLNTAKKASQLGITTHIAGINTPNAITKILTKEPVGTTILPDKKKSNIKRWMAFQSTTQNSSITIHPKLEKLILNSESAISILPIGILKWSGKFNKGDLIDIYTQDAKKIGVGIARYAFDKLEQYLGKKDQPVFIHYDYLHVF